VSRFNEQSGKTRFSTDTPTTILTKWNYSEMLMRRLLTLFLLLNVASLPVHATHRIRHALNHTAAKTNIGERFSKKWSKERPVPYVAHGFHCFEGDQPWYLTAHFIGTLLDTTKLSPKAKFHFTVKDSPDIPLYTTDSASGTTTDLFYCEQAIWEAAPFPQYWGGGPVELGALTEKINNPNIALKLDSMVAPNMVTLHIIPTSINAYKKFPATFTDDELHGVQNLALLSVKNISGARLKAFRSEWVLFIAHSGVTRESTLAFASSLVNRYSDILKLAD
jgi:hypothetical protein